MQGHVSLVGVGPGDPGLLTLRGARAIARADVVLYDALVHPDVLRHAGPDAERLYVGKRMGRDSTSQDEINHTLLLRARQGRRVARLKGGDPLLFARGAEEALFLADHGVSFDVVPGVTAALAVGAYAGVPLSHRDLSSSVALITSREHPSKTASSHVWEHLATATQTLVFYMGVHRIADDMAALVANGRPPETPAAVVQWASHPEQRVVVATVGTLAEACAREAIGAPAVVVVGEVVRLRERLGASVQGPLFGRRVVVTRAREQSEGLADALSDEGATALSYPLIRFENPSDSRPLSRAIEALLRREFTAVAFTSTNGVERFFAELEARELDARCFAGALVAAVGPATASALRARGLRPDCVAREARGEGLAKELLALLGDRCPVSRVLVAQAEIAREALASDLAARGVSVDRVPVYRTVAMDHAALAPLRDELSKGLIDVVTLASGSAAAQLVAALGHDARAFLARTCVASLGPVTSEAARSLGIDVQVEAAATTASGLVEALCDHFRRKRPS